MRSTFKLFQPVILMVTGTFFIVLLFLVPIDNNPEPTLQGSINTIGTILLCFLLGMPGVFSLMFGVFFFWEDRERWFHPRRYKEHHDKSMN